jgi:hypothetical protein
MADNQSLILRFCLFPLLGPDRASAICGLSIVPLLELPCRLSFSMAVNVEIQKLSATAKEAPRRWRIRARRKGENLWRAKGLPRRSGIHL